MTSPEVERARDDAERRALERVRAVVRLMDDVITIPGTRVRIGLDGLIGLVPGAGDAAGAIVSALLILASMRLGAGAPVAARMLLNVAVDALVGLVPVAGDLFDIGWKANRRNLALLESAMQSPARTRRRSGVVVALVGVGAVAVVAAVVWAAVTVMGGVLGLVTRK